MWLIDQEVLAEMRRAKRTGYQPSAEERARYDAILAQDEVQAREGSAPRNFQRAGDVAEIRIEGTLTKQRDIIALLFGGGNTTYQDVLASLSLASSDSNVSRVALYVDSPGGSVDGLFEVLDALAGFRKPIEVTASRAQSAAYGIAAASRGKIRATSRAASFGSVGVAMDAFVLEDLISITSTEAPDKRPDIRTEEGRAVVRKFLDDIHGEFASAIAKGRGISVSKVNEDFGRGASVLAVNALKSGMIDSVTGYRGRNAVVSSEEPIPGGVEVETSAGVVWVDPRTVEAVARATADADIDLPRMTKAERDALTQSNATDPDESASEENPNAADDGGKETAMDYEKLKAEHPRLFNEIMEEGRAKGFEDGQAKGVESERSRCKAHLKMGESYGAMDIAATAIREGKAFADDEIQAEYMSARANAQEQRNRGAESAGAEDAVKGADGGDDAAGGPDLIDRCAATLGQPAKDGVARNADGDLIL